MVIDLLQTLINREITTNSSTSTKDFSVDAICSIDEFQQRELKLDTITKNPDSDEDFKKFRRNLVG